MLPARREIVIPDLRFEQVFRKSLSNYADKANESRRVISSKELDKYASEDGDGSEAQAPSLENRPPPIEPSSPSIVAYAVIRDIMLRPLVEGFLWALICILARPTLRLITRQGFRVGKLFASLFGVWPATT